MKDVVRTLARIVNEALNNVNSLSTMVKVSLPVSVRALAFFDTTLRCQSGLNK